MAFLKKMLLLLAFSSQGCTTHIRENTNLHARALQKESFSKKAKAKRTIPKDLSEEEHTHEIVPGSIVYKTPDTLSHKGFLLQRKITVRLLETDEETQLSRVRRNTQEAYVFSKDLRRLLPQKTADGD